MSFDQRVHDVPAAQLLADRGRHGPSHGSVPNCGDGDPTFDGDAVAVHDARKSVERYEKALA